MMTTHIALISLFVPVGSLVLSGTTTDNIVPSDIAEAHDPDAAVAHRVDFFRRVDLATLHRGVGKNMSDDAIRQKIREIKQLSGKGGMMEKEYFAFMSYVRDRAPQKLLIWGIGYDSTLINALNEGGHTLFLEFNADWVAKTPAATLNYLSYVDADFGTRVDRFTDFVASPHRANISALDSGVCWDTVLVDSPLGYLPHQTGRAVPLYTAKVDFESCVASNSYEHGEEVVVWVHDCNRELETAVSHAFYGEPDQVIGAKRLSKWTFQKVV